MVHTIVSKVFSTPKITKTKEELSLKVISKWIDLKQTQAKKLTFKLGSSLIFSEIKQNPK